MPSAPATILLTGFGPFPGMPENASAALVDRLAAAAQKRFPKRRIVSAVLDTRWDSAPTRLARLHGLERPSLALHFGVSAQARGFVIETVARNHCRQAADAAGGLPASACISDTAPGAVPVTVPATRIAARLTALGYPVRLSDDAGGYICNAVLFHSLAIARRQEARPLTGFIHMPSRIGTGGIMDWDTALAGSLEIIRVCLGLSALEPQR